MISIETVPENTLIGFKALPTHDVQRAIENMAALPSLTHWSALYPQLSLRSSVHYLPNQWERGEVEASIALLYNTVPLRVIVCRDSRMSSSMSSDDKAAALREILLREAHIDLGGALLMEGLGTKGFVLCMLDAEDYEMIIPHNCCGAIRGEVAFRCRNSATLPECTGEVVGHRLLPATVLDPIELGEQLEKLFDGPATCQELRNLLHLQ